MKIRRVLIYLFSVFLFSNLFAAEIVCRATVLDATTRQPIVGANVYSSGIGTVTDETGAFELTVSVEAEITISYIGYQIIIIPASDCMGEVRLEPSVLPGQAVTVSATRAVAGVSPVAFSTLTAAEIQTRYTVEDVPLVLAQEPGVYAYSESGNGTGYSYVSIRGFDQSRIAVLLDGVPLNDNESHQVYWVDHGDILSDAEEVQIQRGIGNSLYGSSAFGGSINVATVIASEQPTMQLQYGQGSYNTRKMSLKGQSGPLADGSVFLTARYSEVTSDGYRENHTSLQRALSLGVEHRTGKLTNQFRTLIGYENTDLAWWGVYSDAIYDRQDRRASYETYTDDFLQQIYSLNTSYNIGDGMYLKNVAYLVRGSGYYEIAKDDCDFYSYNLDIYDEHPDSTEQELTTDLLRRKWIVNAYYGLVPTFTLERKILRLDAGGELRIYSGDHFGEVTDFSEKSLSTTIGNGWYKYYQYYGRKTLLTGFVHFMFNPVKPLRLVADLQLQSIYWSLDQEKIGHAAGHQLNADWGFISPRLGAVYTLTDKVSVFANYGRAHKEPADNLIIEADDMFSEPVLAAVELIDDYELGADFQGQVIHGSVNWYRINYKNEQLKNIDVEQEGEYSYYTADGTIHQGLEYELSVTAAAYLKFGLNGSINNHHFIGGNEKPLPGVPETLLNIWGQVAVGKNLQIFSSLRYVGRQYLAAASGLVSAESIPAFSIIDIGASWQLGRFSLTGKINNLFDELYITNGYDWDGWLYYWPGAARNGYLSVSVDI